MRRVVFIVVICSLLLGQNRVSCGIDLSSGSNIEEGLGFRGVKFPTVLFLQGLADTCVHLGNATNEAQPKAVCHLIGSLFNLAAGVTAHQQAQKMLEAEKDNQEVESRFINFACLVSENMNYFDQKECITSDDKYADFYHDHIYKEQECDIKQILQDPAITTWYVTEIFKIFTDDILSNLFKENEEDYFRSPYTTPQKKLKAVWDSFINKTCPDSGVILFIKEKVGHVVNYVKNFLIINSNYEN